MKFSRIVMLVLCVGGLAFTGLVQAQTTPFEGETTRQFLPADRSLEFTFEYPIATHSVRDDICCLNGPLGGTLTFGGYVSVIPNDSAIYADEVNPPDIVYRMRIAAVVSDQIEQQLGTDDLEAMLGKLALVSYDAELLEDLEIKAIQIGEKDGIRVDGIPLNPPPGLTHILIPHDIFVFEIVIEPIPRVLGLSGNAEPIPQVYEDILASLMFGPLPNTE
jgi:hypothetical protein